MLERYEIVNGGSRAESFVFARVVSTIVSASLKKYLDWREGEGETF